MVISLYLSINKAVEGPAFILGIATPKQRKREGEKIPGPGTYDPLSTTFSTMSFSYLVLLNF
jgi:hypothetical protein